jgi:hypothetical protein
MRKFSQRATQEVPDFIGALRTLIFWGLWKTPAAKLF